MGNAKTAAAPSPLMDAASSGEGRGIAPVYRSCRECKRIPSIVWFMNGRVANTVKR